MSRKCKKQYWRAIRDNEAVTLGALSGVQITWGSGPLRCMAVTSLNFMASFFISNINTSINLNKTHISYAHDIIYHIH